MYVREIQNPRDSPVEDGAPVTCTWNRAFTRVDLLDIRRPFRWPAPKFLRDWRIKEWESFSVQDEHFFLNAFLGNFKLFQIAQIALHNKETGENYTFRKLISGGKWKMPKNLGNASVECQSPHFFFRIHTWLIADTIKLDVDVAATRKQPAFTAHLAFAMSSRNVTPVVVSLNFSEQRSMYAYKALTPVRGDIVLGGKHFSLDPGRCTGIFLDYKGFFPYPMKSAVCCSMGFDQENRRYGFHIAENQAKETYKSNENALWLNKKLTPLPPVRITMPGGPESDWIIQDMDGMVDLVFTPKEQNKIGFSLFTVGGDFSAPMGYYNGVLVSSRNEQIQVHNQWGIGEKLNLRV